ncbi:MBL fold metallo-hydrolase, partial [bacterium]|nr:MBL fold metallo-hydrolase [bacterium]
SIANVDAVEKWWEKVPRKSWSRFERIPQSQEWFEVYRILPGVFAIYEPGQWEEVISYLIVGTNKSFLFDTGLGIGDIKKLVSEITPIEPFVINSHTHYDHIGGNYQFREIYGMDTEFTQLNSKGIPYEEVKEFVSGQWIHRETPKSFVANQYHIKSYSLTKILKDHDRIDLGDRILEIIFIPGHTPDSLCLLDRKNRLLFTGDTFYPAPLYAHFPESNFKQYAQTAKLLHKLQSEVDYVVPSHNETLLPSAYLEKLDLAFQSIQNGTAKFKDHKNDVREYLFDRFSILVKHSESAEQ